MSALELRDVVKHYSTGAEVVRAVDDVSLSILPGEFVALYGPSGSGKTTLLMLAAGLMDPDGGEVLFGGRQLARMSTRERSRYRRDEVGFVFQSFHLIEGASALDNAALKLLGDGCSMRQAHRRVRPWLERVGLGERLTEPPSRLSMGERQRVAIARALANEPRLLLADEPTGNLDSKRSRQVLALLRELAHEHAVSVLLVTHDSQAIEVADRIHTLRDGHLADGLDAELALPSLL
ncbi:MAG TPA: ABC transporter ATP-binding protein [Solirubrobacteraceae bacterium]|nr:ABC transporter ATP-binding protein [Solirubrobacteraceae bacterium]